MGAVTRPEADALMSEYDDETHTYYSLARRCAGVPSQQEAVTLAFHKMNAIRERLIDYLCGEEHTEPLAGNP